jgi:F-type H+-transporting ATPase subunit a
VVTSWGILLLFGLGSWLATRRLWWSEPGPVQTALEGAVQAVSRAIASVAAGAGGAARPSSARSGCSSPVANLTGLIPGLHAPTGDLSATAALAILVFLSTHWYGIRSAGLRAYAAHYLSPNPILLPFHLLGEFSRTLALAVRLFGNIMSLEMAAMLMLLVAGLLIPVPVLMLHVLEALVQAYIFGTLALIYIASGMQSQAAAGAAHPTNDAGGDDQ